MANIKIYKDKTVYPSQYDIINKFENKADKLTFDFSDIEMQGNKYLVFEDNGKAKVPILMIDNAIEITNFISSKPGPHRALVIVSSVELDETLNISDQNIKFISNEFEIVVNDNFITNEAAQEWELPNHLKIPFDELLALIERVKNDLETGALKGPKGDPGDPGPKGDPGIVIPANGVFSLKIIDGNLNLIYNKADTPPSLYINDKGCLIFGKGGQINGY